MHFAGFVELIAIILQFISDSFLSQGIKHDSQEFLLIDNLHRRRKYKKDLYIAS